MTVEEIKQKLAEARAEMERQRLLVEGYETLLRAHGEVPAPITTTLRYARSGRLRYPYDAIQLYLSDEKQPVPVQKIVEVMLDNGWGSGKYFNDSGIMQSLRLNLSLGKLTCGGELIIGADVKSMKLKPSDLIGLPEWTNVQQ
jgi:hypothetical protein